MRNKNQAAPLDALEPTKYTDMFRCHTHECPECGSSIVRCVEINLFERLYVCALPGCATELSKWEPK
jgi:predicted RNA-binding Zn-ribbon protein involved in translation (DUF1610 family)